MDEILKELVKNIPVGVALVYMVRMFLLDNQQRDEKRLAHDTEMETSRVANAKEREADRRNYELEINNMWANHIRSVIENQNNSFENISTAIAGHEAASRERYEKMSITQELFKAAKEARERKEA